MHKGRLFRAVCQDWKICLFAISVAVIATMAISKFYELINESLGGGKGQMERLSDLFNKAKTLENLQKGEIGQ